MKGLDCSAQSKSPLFITSEFGGVVNGYEFSGPLIFDGQKFPSPLFGVNENGR
jgi:hypothetical protein